MQKILAGSVFSVRSLALICLICMLATWFAAPIHHHTADQDGTCLICQANKGRAAGPVILQVNAPVLDERQELLIYVPPFKGSDSLYSTRTPRAPPVPLIAA